MDKVDQRARRQARLQLVVIPPLTILDLFQPDLEGRLEEVSLAEATDRGLEYYLSRRLSPLDKVLETRERVAVCVRATETRMSLGELQLASRKHAARARNADAAMVRAAMAQWTSRR